jgi:hypothetical protein
VEKRHSAIKECYQQSYKDTYLYLDGSYESLIDNGLRCFGLKSVTNWNEHITRIWHHDEYLVNDVYINRLKLFEFGLRNEDNFATNYILEWQKEDDDLRVICIKKENLLPEQGWKTFNILLKRHGIDSLQRIKQNHELPLSMGWDFVYIQYLNPGIVETINLSNRSPNIPESKDQLEMAYVELIKRIYYSFNLDLSGFKSKEHNIK